MRPALCVHAHFYQPPRYNPITGAIPREYGAAPYGNFNEKILQECYRPIAEAGFLDNLSFNMGPTLAEWLEVYAPHVYGSYIGSDVRVSRKYGAGNAIAQAYNHAILPLLSHRDKTIQIYWGITDFRHRYGRNPIGFWLPETAADYETLEILKDHGIRYTFLAPWQIKGERYGSPVRVSLKNGFISVFAYDSFLTRVWISTIQRFSVSSFEHYCMEPYVLSRRTGTEGNPQVLTLAFDGEFMGHHIKNRDKVLGDLFAGYATMLPVEFLESSAVLPEAELIEKTSWTCFSRLERWRESCSLTDTGKCPERHFCFISDNAWTNQLWTLLEEVQETVWSLFDLFAGTLVNDPRALVYEYLGYRLKTFSFAELIRRAQQKRRIAPHEKERLLTFLEALYYCQLMFTSCGFFFEDIDRIEPANNLRYMKKVLMLLSGELPEKYESLVEKRLAAIHSQKRHGRTARAIYRACS